VLYAFDLIEHDGEDFRRLPFLECKAALARLLEGAKVRPVPSGDQGSQSRKHRGAA
jgi:ATP-dependent DNA ligase